MALRTTSASLLAWTVSAGCVGDVPKDLIPGDDVLRSFQQQDSNPLLGRYQREYMVRLPQGYTGKERLPLLFYFHGWGDDFEWDGSFQEMSNKHNLIIVKPNGMTDGQDQMRSWNVGQPGRTDICNHKDVTEYEYTSCLTTKNTSICNCGTCYDDVRFTSDLAASLHDDLCIDESRIFASGTSFGAMFSYFLPPDLQRIGSTLRIRAVLPWYGAFYRNMLEVPQSVAGTSLLHFHGIGDTEVTMDGSESDDGYYFVPNTETMRAFARVNGCDASSRKITTQWDGQGNHNTGKLIGCEEWAGCTSAARVVLCSFHGGHGIWPAYSEKLMWSFLGTLSSETSVV